MNAKQKRRYNLHYKLRKTTPFKLYSRNKMIIVDKANEEIAKQDRYVKSLQEEYQYIVQLSLNL